MRIFDGSLTTGRDATVSKQTTKAASEEPAKSVERPRGPLWSRVPKGWIVLALFVLAWVGVFLIWNGVILLLRA